MKTFLKAKKTLLSVLLLTLFLSLSLAAFPAAVSVKAEALQATQVQSNVMLEEQIYNDLYNAFPEYAGANRVVGSSRTISSIKQLRDFADNCYYIVEFIPCGFSIYDSTFTVALEINAVAQSPYFDLADDLIYAGPTRYYIKPDFQPVTGGLFIHTVLNTNMVVDDDGMDLLIESSNDMNSNINNHLQEVLAEQTRATTIQTVTLVSRTTITNLSTSGFNTQGNCGYVAGAVITWYQRQVWGSTQLAPNGWSVQLVADIQDGRANGANGSNVRWAISDYIKTCNASDRITDFIWPNAGTIYDLVDASRPVAIGSTTMPDPTGGDKMAHMVVVHKVERTKTTGFLGIPSYSGYKYWCHFGWGTTWNDHMILNSAFNMDSRVNFH